MRRLTVTGAAAATEAGTSSASTASARPARRWSMRATPFHEGDMSLAVGAGLLAPGPTAPHLPGPPSAVQWLERRSALAGGVPRHSGGGAPRGGPPPPSPPPPPGGGGPLARPGRPPPP